MIKNQKAILETLSKLKSQSGGTSLITYYIQGSTSIWLVVEKLQNELSTCSNIKSKNVRKEVESALRSALYQMNNLKSAKIPDNGLVLCAENVIENKDCL